MFKTLSNRQNNWGLSIALIGRPLEALQNPHDAFELSCSGLVVYMLVTPIKLCRRPIARNTKDTRDPGPSPSTTKTAAVRVRTEAKRSSTEPSGNATKAWDGHTLVAGSTQNHQHHCAFVLVWFEGRLLKGELQKKKRKRKATRPLWPCAMTRPD